MTQVFVDAWRAFLVVVVVSALREPPVVQNQWAPAVQNQWQAPAVEPRPIRRVGTAIAELAESVVSLLK